MFKQEGLAPDVGKWHISENINISDSIIEKLSNRGDASSLDTVC